jgi:hypothetical protein
MRLFPAGVASPYDPTLQAQIEAALVAGSANRKIKSEPTMIGLAKPTGGWTCVFGDAFEAPLGTGAGEDNFWLPNRFSDKDPAENQAGQNSNELQVFHNSQVKLGPKGLELDVTYSPNVGESYGSKKNYLGSMLQGVNRETMKAGYNYFQFLLGAGSTFAFEIVCKFPPNTGEMNNAFWALASPWLQEFDFWEAWGWNTHENSTILYNGGATWLSIGEKSSETTGDFIQGEQQIGKKFDPSAAFHRLGIVVFPNNTFSMYIDGILQKSVGKFPSSGILGPAKTVNPNYMGLILQNALRNFGENFKEGKRTFYVESVAVYQDTPHVGNHTHGGGLAPGTVLF